MKLSELILSLRSTLAKEGDLDVVSGVARSGYGEPIIDVNVSSAHSFNEQTGEFDGPTLKVVDLLLSDSSLVSE